MKPLRLKMQAFGSYGKETTIDFEKVNQNLFLITGDTGAGKTTIFDAIVFALYGEASSSLNKKEGVVLQSQYVEFGCEPAVELAFAEGSGENCEIYTVRRVPRHLKTITRGAGKGKQREITGSVSLIMPDGMEYPSKEADRKLQEIVGLTKSQFMQVAMIAQGEFMDLLRAKSDDKKKIAILSYFHSKKEPSIDHRFFATYNDSEKIKIIKLIAILKVADSLDRSHKQQVKDIIIKIDNSNMILELAIADEPLIEKWAFEKKSELFSEVFGLNVKLILRR
mgnify:CR=1 FL=1